MQVLYNEMSRVVRDDLALGSATILNKYFTQASMPLAPNPKFIYLSGQPANIQALLYLFGNRNKFTTPPNSASVWVNYYEKADALTLDERWLVEVVYCENPENLAECKTLTYDEFNQTNGLM